MKRSEKLFLAALILCAPIMDKEVALAMGVIAGLVALLAEWRGD